MRRFAAAAEALDHRGWSPRRVAQTTGASALLAMLRHEGAVEGAEDSAGGAPLVKQGAGESDPAEPVAGGQAAAVWQETSPLPMLRLDLRVGSAASALGSAAISGWAQHVVNLRRMVAVQVARAFQRAFQDPYRRYRLCCRHAVFALFATLAVQRREGS